MIDLLGNVIVDLQGDHRIVDRLVVEHAKEHGRILQFRHACPTTSESVKGQFHKSREPVNSVQWKIIQIFPFRFDTHECQFGRLGARLNLNRLGHINDRLPPIAHRQGSNCRFHHGDGGRNNRRPTIVFKGELFNHNFTSLVVHTGEPSSRNSLTHLAKLSYNGTQGMVDVTLPNLLDQS